MRRTTFSCWTAAIALAAALLGFGAKTAIDTTQIRSATAGPALLGISTSKTGVLYKIGFGLAVKDGQLDVTTVPVTVPEWQVERLTAGADGAYPLPSGAYKALRVYVGGARYWSPEDWSLVDGVIVPACVAGSGDCNWPVPSAEVAVHAEFQR